MIEVAQQIILTAEDKVLGSFSTSKPWVNQLIRGLIAPWLLLARGFQDLSQHGLRAMLGASAGAVIGLLLPVAGGATRGTNAWLLAITCALVALLPSPSHLCRMVDSSAVLAVAQQLRDKGVHSQSQIDALTTAVAMLERRPLARIAALRWIMGVAWAATVYAFAQTLASAADVVITQAYIQLALIALLAAVTLYLLVRTYSSPTELVFESVYLGLAQHSYELQAES